MSFATSISHREQQHHRAHPKSMPPSKEALPLTNAANTKTHHTITSTASEIFRVFKKIGLFQGKKITDTLQGSIWRALTCTTNGVGKMKSVVIKRTNQTLFDQSCAVIQSKIFSVQENILMEKSILKYLTQSGDCPNSIVKFQCFFKTYVY